MTFDTGHDAEQDTGRNVGQDTGRRRRLARHPSTTYRPGSSMAAKRRHGTKRQ